MKSEMEENPTDAKCHSSDCCFWTQDEPPYGDPDWCDCGFVKEGNLPWWVEKDSKVHERERMD